MTLIELYVAIRLFPLPLALTSSACRRDGRPPDAGEAGDGEEDGYGDASIIHVAFTATDAVA